jgi:porin
VHKLAFRFGVFALAVFSSPVMAEDESGPVRFGATNLADVMSNVKGGLRRGTRVMDKIDLTATYLGDDNGLPGFSIFLDGQMTDGADLSGALVGAAQALSNLEAPAQVRLADAWMAWAKEGKAGVKLGVIDLNTEFDVQATGALFLNSAFGIGPDFSQSGQNGPSIFPSTGLGLVGWWLPGGHWQVKAGLFEGVPGDPMHPGRTRFVLSRDEGALVVLEARNHINENFVLGAGAWHLTASLPAIDPARGNLSGNAGYYAIADGLIYEAPEGEGAGLSAWTRFGWADARINPISMTVNGGLVYSAPFGREKDQAGVSVAHAWFGAPARNMLGMGVAETMWEATYSFSLNSHFSLQPDIQYVMSPSGGPAPDALVLGSRIAASW